MCDLGIQVHYRDLIMHAGNVDEKPTYDVPSFMNIKIV